MSIIKTATGWVQLAPTNCIPASNNTGRYTGELPTPAEAEYSKGIALFMSSAIDWETLQSYMSVKVDYPKADKTYSLNPWDEKYDRSLDPKMKDPLYVYKCIAKVAPISAMSRLFRLAA